MRGTDASPTGDGKPALLVEGDGLGCLPEVVELAFCEAAAGMESTAVHELEHVFGALDVLVEDSREVADPLRRVRVRATGARLAKMLRHLQREVVLARRVAA